MMLGSLFLLFPLVLVGLVAVFPILNKLVILLWTKLKDRTPALPCSAGGESSSSSDTLNSTPPWKHDVFLSFAGKDTRLKFLSHLDEAFKTSGIKPFKDDVDLERGGVIKEDLIQGIQDSLCAVLVISENYADSTWCLDELQKIIESRKSLGRRVFPIFYDVDPSDVRNQRKSFGKAFAKHEKNFRENPAVVQNWRNALSEIGNISGHDTRGKDSHWRGVKRILRYLAGTAHFGLVLQPTSQFIIQSFADADWATDKDLKSLPRLPPRLIRLDTARCNSMEPLSERRLWNLVASLDHEYRGRTKYVMSEEEHDDIPLEQKRGHVDVEHLPLRDFCAIIPGHRIPSWFPNIKYLVKDRWEYEIKVNIPQKCRDSEWSGIVVCLLFSCDTGSIINWSSKAAEDDDYIFKDWAHFIAVRR